MSSLHNRREFLRGGALLAVASALGFAGAFGLRRAEAADGDDVQTIVNVAATAETFACTHYYRTLTSNIRFTSQQTQYIRAALEQELAHLEFLNANGAKALADSFYFPVNTYRSAISFGAFSAIAETVFVGAYLAAARRFAELGNPLLAATAAQVAVIEGQHLALVRQTAGELPNNVALGEPKFWNTSEAAPVLEPILTGKGNSLGKLETSPVKFPGADAIHKLISKSALSPVKPFTDPSLAPGAAASATAAATPAATMAATEAK